MTTNAATATLPQRDMDFDASIPGAHLIPDNSTSLPGLVTKVIKVDGATPGTAPTVTFSVMDKSSNPVDISKITYIRVVLGGPNVDYGTGTARISGLRRSQQDAGQQRHLRLHHDEQNPGRPRRAHTPFPSKLAIR